jgi:hypothetical protein
MERRFVCICNTNKRDQYVRGKAGYRNDATRMDPRTWLKPGADTPKEKCERFGAPGGALSKP